MKYLMVMTALVLLSAMSATGAIPDEVFLQIDQGFSLLGQVENPASANAMILILANPGFSEGDWRPYWETRFDPVWFTPTLAGFWGYAVDQSGTARSRVMAHSARCAATALGGLVGRTLAGERLPAQLEATAGWLNRVAPQLDAVTRTEVLSLASQALDRTGARDGALPPALSFELGMALQPLVGDDPEARSRLAGLLGLSEGGRIFWSRHSILLLDGGLLTPAHVDSLSSLLSAVPPQVHRVTSIVIREATGPAGLPAMPVGQGQTLFLNLVPMDFMNDPSDFMYGVDRPRAPVFTLDAGIALIAAIQEVQFAARPELRVWRDAILRHARAVPQNRLRRSVDASVYQDRPDAFLPDIAALWFANTRATFDLAMALSQRGNNDAMASFLLFADLISGGDAELRLVETNPRGQVRSNTVPAGRVVPEKGSVAFLNTFSLNNRLWTFTLNEYGHVTGHWRK